MLPQKLLFSRADLKALGIDASDSSLLRWEYHGRFPRRLKLARTRVAWLAEEIQQWLKDAAARRDDDHYTEPD